MDNSLRTLKDALRYLDEYNEANTITPLRYCDNEGHLRESFNSDVNLVTAWFNYLLVTGKISPEKRISKLDKYNNISTLSEVTNLFTSGTSLLVLIQSSDLFSIIDQQDNEFEVGDWTCKVDKVVSNFLHVKNYTDDIVFVEFTNGDLTDFVVVVGSGVHTSSGYSSKIFAQILSSSVRWAKSLLLNELSEKETSFLGKLCDDVNASQSTNISNSEAFPIFAELINEAVDIVALQKKKIMKFSNLAMENSLRNIEGAIREKLNYIEDYMNRLLEFRNALQKLKSEQCYLRLKIGEENPEFNEFVDLLFDKCLDIQFVGSRVYFFHKSTIDFLSGQDFAEDSINSPRNDFSEEMIILMTELFIDETVKYSAFSKYYIDFNTTDYPAATCLQEATSSEYNRFEDALPNPHHFHYDCMGDIKYNAMECCKNGDYYGALTQLFYSTAQANLEDEAVWDHFIDDLNCCLYGDWADKKAFVLKGTNEYVTAQEIVKKYKEANS